MFRKIFLLITLFASVAIAALIVFKPSDKIGPVINTPQGPVQGQITPNQIHNFKGLPFAAPPTGDLRWRPPVLPVAWNKTRDASSFGNQCMQLTGDGGGFLDLMIERHGLSSFKKFLIRKAVSASGDSKISEDCLYLNVRTPNLDDTGNIKGDALPVMVWIHGGGHQFGSGDFNVYQADSLPQKGVVLVTINYRLGVFGYMAHPALSADDPRGVSGNYGTLDQIAALKWVRDNISAYGGDPENVTIFGESAGAWSVTELMSAPAAKGLFHRAIGQSGASTYHLGQMADDPTEWRDGYEGGLLLSAALGLDNPTAQDLRAIEASKILEAVTFRISEAFHHVRDGVVFPKNVGHAFQDGDYYAVPTMFGYNSDESTVFFPNDPNPTLWSEDVPRDDRAGQINALQPHFGDQAARLVELYGLDKDFDHGGEQMMGDEIFGVNVRLISKLNSRRGEPAYSFIFTRIPPNEKQTIGAFHFAETPFVFGSPQKIFGWSKEDDALAETMQNYWVNFARTGNPNGTGLPEWPEYGDGNWMQLSANDNLNTEAIKDYRKEKLDILEAGMLQKLELIRPQSALSPVAVD